MGVVEVSEGGNELRVSEVGEVELTAVETDDILKLSGVGE